jgi:integrase
MGLRRLLTDRFCATAKARDGEVQSDYFDTQVSGLALRVSGWGRKSWTLHYSLDGKRKRLTFGTYPTLGLGGARTRADEIKADVATGATPQLIAGDTLRGICDEYMRREGGKLRSAAKRKSVLERHVYPTLGSRPIAEIRRIEIVRLLDRIEESSGPETATQALAIVRKIMNWYATRSDDFRSPIVRGMARTNPSERARDRILSDDELRKIWRTAEGCGVFGLYLRFLLLTAARRSEVAAMTWAEIDGNDWLLPAARNKTGVDLVRPLSRASQDILEGLPKAVGSVWSTNGGVRAISDFSGFKSKLDAASGVKGWRLHDLRRTARSLMSRAGVPTDHAERCLGHVIGGVRGVYDRHAYHEEKRQAFEALAAEVDRIVSRPADLVTERGTAR